MARFGLIDHRAHCVRHASPGQAKASPQISAQFNEALSSQKVRHKILIFSIGALQQEFLEQRAFFLVDQGVIDEYCHEEEAFGEGVIDRAEILEPLFILKLCNVKQGTLLAKFITDRVHSILIYF